MQVCGRYVCEFTLRRQTERWFTRSSSSWSAPAGIQPLAEVEMHRRRLASAPLRRMARRDGGPMGKHELGFDERMKFVSDAGAELN